MKESISRQDLFSSIKKYVSKFSDNDLTKKMERRRQLIAMRKWFDGDLEAYECSANVEVPLNVESDERSFKWSSNSIVWKKIGVSQLSQINETSRVEERQLAGVA